MNKFGRAFQFQWTDEIDQIIRTMRGKNPPASWEAIANAIGGISASSVINRSYILGIHDGLKAPNPRVNLIWSPAMDELILKLRHAQHRPWDFIASVLMCSRSAVIDRHRLLKAGGAKLPESEQVGGAMATSAGMEMVQRTAYPPGHPVTWGAITKGTCLEGAPYVYTGSFTSFPGRTR